MEPLENGNFYHIYNRGNNKETLFFEETNYYYFLQLVARHILPIASIYSYCLLKNHFHILVRIREHAQDPSKKFSNLFNAYTKAINKKYSRTGSLFQKPFRRIKITDEKYLKTVLIYIHLNPTTHKIFTKFADYPYSSFSDIVLEHSPMVNTGEVLSWFGDKNNFIFVHHQRKDHLDLYSEDY